MDRESLPFFSQYAWFTLYLHLYPIRQLVDCARQCAREHLKRPSFYPTASQDGNKKPPGTIEDSEGSRFYVRFRKPLLYPTELRGLQSLYTCVGEHTVNDKYHRPVPLIQIISDVVLNNSRYLTELHLSCPQT